MKVKQKKRDDVLACKQAELDAYVTQFDNAVSVVTNAVSNLSRINAGIIEKIQEIDDYKSELEKIRDGLDATRNKNTQVIKNFNALLGI